MDAAVRPKNAPKFENQGAAQQAETLSEMGSLLPVTFVDHRSCRRDLSGMLCLGNLRHSLSSSMDSRKTFERSDLTFRRLMQPSASPLPDLH